MSCCVFTSTDPTPALAQGPKAFRHDTKRTKQSRKIRAQRGHHFVKVAVPSGTRACATLGAENYCPRCAGHISVTAFGAVHKLVQAVRYDLERRGVNGVSNSGNPAAVLGRFASPISISARFACAFRRMRCLVPLELSIVCAFVKYLD